MKEEFDQLKTELEELRNEVTILNNKVSEGENGLTETKSELTILKESIGSTRDEFGIPVVEERDIDRSLKTSGSIRFRQSNTLYRLEVLSKPKKIEFYGNAVHYSSGIAGQGGLDIRAMVVGSCFFGSSYYFQPKTDTIVTPGGIPQQFVQSSSYLLIAGSTVNAIASEGHIVSTEYPAGTVAARITVEKVDKDAIHLRVYLLPGWEINGNFVVS